MTTSPLSNVTLSTKDYRQIALNMFQKYADECFKGKFLKRSMKINFKYWTKENWDVLNSKTWYKILGYFIPHDV